MPVPSKEQSIVARKATKKRKSATEMKPPAAKKANIDPPVVDLAGEVDDAESSSEDMTSVSQPSPSVSAPSNSKRKRPGGPKKKSNVWKFFSEEKETNITRCCTCSYELTPAGHTGNAVAHLKNNHSEVFADFRKQEKCRKEAEKKKQPSVLTTLVQPKIKFESLDPYPISHPR